MESIMFIATHLIKRQCMFEGFRAVPYLDTLGVWTIGFGATMWAGERVTKNTPAVTLEAALVEMRADMFQAVVDCQALYTGRFDLMHDHEQEVLCHMAFQLGRHKLAKFVNMNQAVMFGDIDNWVAEMKDSLWWKQTPRPAMALAEAVFNSDWRGQWNMG